MNCVREDQLCKTVTLSLQSLTGPMFAVREVFGIPSRQPAVMSIFSFFNYHSRLILYDSAALYPRTYEKGVW